MTGRAITPPTHDDLLVWNVVGGVYSYPAALIAHKLGLFRLLGSRAGTADEVAAALEIPRRSARALLSNAAALGFLAADQGRYRLTLVAEEYLLPESPHYFGHYWDAKINSSWVWSLDSLEKAVRTGVPQPVPEEIYSFYGDDSSLTEEFTLDMRAMGAPAQVWPKLIDFSGHHTMLDIGGGSGNHSIGVVCVHPPMRSIIMDLPPVPAAAEDYVKTRGFSDEVSTHAGDMFTDPFPDADVHLYSSVFLDWPLEKCRQLAEKSFRALPSGAHHRSSADVRQREDRALHLGRVCGGDGGVGAG